MAPRECAGPGPVWSDPGPPSTPEDLSPLFPVIHRGGVDGAPYNVYAMHFLVLGVIVPPAARGRSPAYGRRPRRNSGPRGGVSPVSPSWRASFRSSAPPRSWRPARRRPPRPTRRSACWSWSSLRWVDSGFVAALQFSNRLHQTLTALPDASSPNTTRKDRPRTRSERFRNPESCLRASAHPRPSRSREPSPCLSLRQLPSIQSPDRSTSMML